MWCSYMNDISLYRKILRIRRIEEAFSVRYKQWNMRCPMHLSIGQEAVAIGVSEHLTNKDHVFSNHRSHGHYLAKGGSLKKMVAEAYGKETGCCGGRGGSMHLVDLDVGFIGSTPIVGGTVPLAVGDAWSALLQNIDRVTLIYFGDGCFEEGVLHESMNFAVLHQLPVVFVCENNSYSVYTQIVDRQPDRKIVDIAKAHGLKTEEGDGNDIPSVSKIAANAINNVRDGGGPQFIEYHTYRWLEHCGPNDDDDLGYRPKGELSVWKDRCPIAKLENLLLKDGVITVETKEIIEKEIESEIAEAFEYALTSIPPASDSMSEHLYA